MGSNKKFYWLKLNKDFFKRHDIRIIEDMENGKEYVLFYMKLLLESVDHVDSRIIFGVIPGEFLLGKRVKQERIPHYFCA